MYFEPDQVGMRPEPFTHSVTTALVTPRPIGWISTMSADGVINLAPFSYSNLVSADPPCVMYCPAGFKTGTDRPKDSLVNVEATGEFVFNLCTEDLAERMNETSAHVPASVDEMAEAGLTAGDCHRVRPPRVAESPVALECVHLQTVQLPPQTNGGPNVIVIGRVAGVHVSDDVIVDGRVDVGRIRPVARLGYMDYATVGAEQMFQMTRPD